MPKKTLLDRDGKLVLKDGTEFFGKSFGGCVSVAGEVVFSTGMVGYPQSLTDPSYKGQILIFTYPLIGNYGVPPKKYWESDGVKVSAVIVSSYIDTPFHYQNTMSLSTWLRKENIPALEIKDTRFLTKKIREEGTMLGKIVIDKDISFFDPNKENLVKMVSTKKVLLEGKGKKTIALIDCGLKENIRRSLLKRNVRLLTVPWDLDLFSAASLRGAQFDGIVVSNGPGDPKVVVETIKTIEKAIKRKTPTLGICLGNQILALAAGGDTFKLKYGHRGQNQPCILVGTNRCFLTTQNHGFAVGKIPDGFGEWFKNANDFTNEGIICKKYPFMSVQFHPESSPGPFDTEWIFDYFLKFV